MLLRETTLPDPCGPLRAGEVDVQVTWMVFDEPDLTAGPVIEYRDRVLAVAASHPFAALGSVSVEDLAGQDIARGVVVHPTMAGALPPRQDITLVPIRDLPPVPLGLARCTAHENERIRALAAVAAQLAPGLRERGRGGQVCVGPVRRCRGLRVRHASS